MPKAKVTHKTFKLTPEKSKNNIGLIALGIFAIFLIVSSYIYSNVQKVSINETREAGSIGSSMMLRSTFRDCETVKTFSLNSSCGNSNYQVASFTCGNSREVRKIGDNDRGQKQVCKPFTTLYSEAQSICLSACPKASGIPSTKPTPSSLPLASGCFYEQPKCIQAPCPQIMRCGVGENSPVAKPSFSPKPRIILDNGTSQSPEF